MGSKVYSCINAVQNRAIRFYLGTGKYTPDAAVSASQHKTVEGSMCILVPCDSHG